ncbi:hypothetical protein IWW36_004184 [Coemansia brasiliensis]|uniref:Uncharacterized protein n=1 Tax=Coemansia brasiliensis TaxID=2650707 RepID=A0A9W8I8S7_9FUNG|nr:hypothetical protein IWW36_004184 [Coemansia brasiliensis]
MTGAMLRHSTTLSAIAKVPHKYPYGLALIRGLSTTIPSKNPAAKKFQSPRDLLWPTPASPLKTRLKPLSNDLPFADRAQPTSDRAQDLNRLEQLVSNSDVYGAYKHVYLMKKNGLLRTATGSPTTHVIVDTEVAMELARLIAKHYNWDECLGVLKLIFKKLKHPRHKQAGLPDRSSQPDPDPQALIAVINAVLSPRFTGLPGRRSAGQTAHQILNDFSILWKDPSYPSMRIRACGFTSNIHSLRRLASRTSISSPKEKFELALAYVRCLEPTEGMELLAALSDLSKEQKIEAHMALCASYSEKAMYSKAKEQLDSLMDDSLWSGDQNAFEKKAAVYNTRINMVLATALALTPRMPFTYYYHTIASAHCSPKYSDQRQPSVSSLLQSLTADIKEDVGQDQRQQFSLNANLFRCKCAVYSMCVANGHSTELTLELLATQLHSLQQEFVHKTGSEATGYYGGEYMASILRSYLWCLVFTVNMHPYEKIQAAWDELKHIIAYIPWFQQWAEVLEPTLVLLVPRSMWTSSEQGKFKANSAFMLSDKIMSIIDHHQPVHVLGRKIMELASTVNQLQSGMHRLYPLRVLLAHESYQLATPVEIAEQSLEAPQMGIVPGALSMTNNRNARFYEELISALSLRKFGASFAIDRIRAIMLSQVKPVYMTERIAAALLYCCVRTRNEVAARDILAMLDKQGVPLSLRVQELYMRASMRAGLMDRVLVLFHKLNYESGPSLVEEPSYVCLMDYFSVNRESLVGAEHAFDTWLQIYNYQGRITPKLADMWQQVGMTDEARSSTNMFMPKTPLAKVMQAAHIQHVDAGKFSSKHFIRDWEFYMVMSLIKAYVVANQVEKMQKWEQWILEAIRNRQLAMKPELISRINSVLCRHLDYESWDHVESVLDFIVAIDQSHTTQIIRSPMFYNALRPTYSRLAVFIKRKDMATRSAKVQSYLQAQDASRTFKFIEREFIYFKHL